MWPPWVVRVNTLSPRQLPQEERKSPLKPASSVVESCECYRLVMKFVRNIPWLLAPLLFSGCYEIAMEFDVNEDGSGSYEMALEVDLEAVAGFVGDEDADPTAICEEMLSDAGGDELAGDGAEIRTENDGSTCRQIVIGSWPAGAADLLEGSGEDLSLTQVGEGWRFEYNISTLTADVDEDEEMDPEMLALMGVEIGYSLSVTLPGSITEHNGDASGSTVSWEFNLLDPPEEEVLFAQSGAGGSGGSTGIIVIVVVVALVAGGVVLLMRRRASSPSSEPEHPAE